MLGARIAAVVVLLIGIAGCGEQEPVPPVVSAGEKAELSALVEQARDAATATDRAGARRALSEVRKRIIALREAGDVDPDRAAALITAVDQALARAIEEIPAPPAPDPAPPEATPPPPSPHGDEEEGEDEEEEGEDG